MLNFTVGPVMSFVDTLDIGGQSSPYFRTEEFSKVMLENEQYMLKFLQAPSGSRCIFMTVSGTGAMEACVMNVLNTADKVLVINGGSFGQRFVDLCQLYHRDFSEIRIEFGHQVLKSQLVEYAHAGYTALLVNMNETSSGTLYDMRLLSQFCRENHLLLIVDAISSFLCDELNMQDLGAAAVITSSQKALAVHPGISAVTMSPAVLKRVDENDDISMYLSFKSALKNGERGQTPFTPAVTVLLEIHQRLAHIEQNGGVSAEIERVGAISRKFRDFIKQMPFEFVSQASSQAVTALHPLTAGAKFIVEVMKRDYAIWLCPNGGELADQVFRVGHIGCITHQETMKLEEAFRDMKKRGLL